MAATVSILEKNGSGPTTTDKTGGTVRFKNADNASVDLVNPMVKPSSGSDWSFEKWLRASMAGTYTQITNLVAYLDGSNNLGTGINLWGRIVTAYATPVEPSASTGLTNAFGYTSSSPATLAAGPLTGTGEKGDHLVLTLEVTSTAPGGLTPTETLTFAWDEI